MSPSAKILQQALAGEQPTLGPFRLLRPLGAGGFAPVFLASETYGGVELRTVAVKLFVVEGTTRLPGAHSAGTAYNARDVILEEARALCRVEHPNVVRFLQIAEDESELLIGLAMEHVQGRSLADRLQNGGPMPVDQVLELGAAVASALSAVHAAGLVHRDVKPPNIIDANGVYKLIDFGIAVHVREAPTPSLRPPGPVDAQGDTMFFVGKSETDARTDVVGAGTPGYIDPACFEQKLPADATSDLYGLGATLYECLCGRLPASKGAGPLASEYERDVLFGRASPPSLRHAAPFVPEAVARLVDSLVAPRREDRPLRAAWVSVELERLRRTLRGRTRPLPAEGPFRGLGPFEEQHRDVYFGRSTDSAAAIEVLRTRGLLALVGASGGGKSSLARAGVLPSITEGALGAWPPAWRTVSVVPGTDPQKALRDALELPSLPDDPAALVASLSAGVESDACGLVVLVDQLEELVTQSDAEGRAWMAGLLAKIGQSPVPGLRAVVTLRRDFLDALLEIPNLGAPLIRGTQLVLPLTRSAWVAVLEDGLGAFQYRLEDAAMKTELAGELQATSEAMPLVAFALTKLWEERDSERRVIPRAALQRIGGLAGALEHHAEETLAKLVSAHGAHAEEVTRRVLVALTTARGTRARRAKDELAREVGDARYVHVLASLEKARLVVEDEGQVALAHEALLDQWRRLRGWVEASRGDRQLAAEIEEASAGWTARAGTDRLWRGARLAEARTLTARRSVALSAVAVRFLKASGDFERRGRIGFFVLVLSIVLGAAAVGFTYMRSEWIAQEEKKHAANLVLAMSQPKDFSELERTRQVMDLQRAKTACERDLRRARADCADAGAPLITEGGAQPAPE